MTRSAVNVIALLSAGQQFCGDREGHVVSGIVAQLAGVKICVFLQLATRNGAFDRRAGGAQVRVEIAARERFEARLVVHILAASGQGEQGGE